jgi:hypothetical protein
MIVETNLHKTASTTSHLTSTRYTLDEAHLHRLGQFYKKKMTSYCANALHLSRQFGCCVGDDGPKGFLVL